MILLKMFKGYGVRNFKIKTISCDTKTLKSTLSPINGNCQAVCKKFHKKCPMDDIYTDVGEAIFLSSGFVVGDDGSVLIPHGRLGVGCR